MILAICIAGALHSVVAHAAPTFQLSYDAELVGFSPDEDSKPLQHIAVRYERVPGTQWVRYTRTTDGSKQIIQSLKEKVLVENIAPNGSRDSKEMPMAEFEKMFKGRIEEAGFSLESFTKANSKKLNEFKTIVGVKCQKHILSLKTDEGSVEMVTFEPVDPKINAVLNQFEAYTYAVEGETRTLRYAETVVSFHPAKANPKLR
jgi:hypothetical protein